MFSLISSVLFACMAVYVIWRLIRPAPLPLWIKIVLGLMIVVGAERMLIMRLVLGFTADWPLNRNLMLASSAVQVSVVVFFVLVLIRDCLALLLSRFGKQSACVFQFQQKWGLRGTVILALCACLIAGKGLHEAFKTPEVREIAITVHYLPPVLDGLRLVQLSDLHIGPMYDRAWLETIVERVNALKPDLICITGDLTDGSPERLAEEVAPLAQLRALYGVFVSLGNHDYYVSPHWMKTFTNMGLTVLINQHRIVRIAGERLVIAGVADPAALRMGAPLPNPVAALSGAPLAPSIILDHRPAQAPANAAAGASLQLAGHTHGGLIAPLAPLVQYFNNGFVSGLYLVDNMPLYVNNGAGLWAGFPVRLGVPSEITLITLKTPHAASPAP